MEAAKMELVAETVQAKEAAVAKKTPRGPKFTIPSVCAGSGITRIGVVVPSVTLPVVALKI